jgi:Cft2 family RNA processing exonuclease
MPNYFRSLCRAVDVGGSSFELVLGDTRVILDAGMHPKYEGSESLPNFDLLDDRAVDAIIVTHAHLDHSGSLPVLFREHVNAGVFMTEETLDLVEAMLHNSVNVMTSKREERQCFEYPFFTHRELDTQAQFWQSHRFGKSFYLDDLGEVRAEFFPAGHVLGASGIKIEAGDKSVFYTGDVHFEDQTLSRAAAFPDESVDLLIMETTRGHSPRPAEYTREKEVARLAQHIADALARGGAALIPVFALGKTQELLLMLHQMKGAGQIPDVPVMIGGLSTKMSTIYDHHADRSVRHFENFRLLDDMDLMVAPRRNRKRTLEFNPGCIYALSSGMMTENTVSNGFAKHILADERNALLFIGYAAEDTPARTILESEPGDLITLSPDDEPLPLNCQVEKFDFSGHATREQLLDYALRVQPTQIALVHGDIPARLWFKEQLEARMPDTKVTIAEPGVALEF